MKFKSNSEKTVLCIKYSCVEDSEGNVSSEVGLLVPR